MLENSSPYANFPLPSSMAFFEVSTYEGPILPTMVDHPPLLPVPLLKWKQKMVHDALRINAVA